MVLYIHGILILLMVRLIKISKKEGWIVIFILILHIATILYNSISFPQTKPRRYCHKYEISMTMG